MADLHRLIRSLIFLIFGILIGGGVTFEAYAESYTAPQRWSFQLSSTYVGDTALAACQAGGALYGYSSISVINLTVAAGDCRNNATSSVFGSVQLVSYCPAGHTQAGNTCTAPSSCPAGQTRLPNGSCGIDCSQNVNDKLGQPVFYNGISATTLCDGSCSYNIGGSVGVCTSDGKCYAAYGSKTGTSCSTSNIASGNSPEFDCLKQGKSYGTINGTVVCMSQGSTGSQNVTNKPPVSTSTTSSGGNNTTTSSSTTYTVNNNGTVTSTTTTTTIVNGGTPQVTTEQETKPKENFCNENPELRICKEGTFAGSCGSYQCDGDAATCALAKKVHQDRCDDLQENAQSTLGNQIFSGNDPEANNNPASPANRDTIELGGSINENSEFAGGCPQDKLVTVMGHVITIPFSNMCSILEILGSIVLAFSFVAAGRIVGAY